MLTILWSNWNSYALPIGKQMLQKFWSTTCQFHKVNNTLINDPAISLLNIYPYGLKTYFPTKTYENYNSIIIKMNGHNPDVCQRQMDEQSVVHPYNEIILRIKQSDLLIHTIWKHPKCIWQSEKSQAPNVTYCIVSFI